MNKKVIKLFFAMLSVLGAGALVACSSQTKSNEPSIVETSNHDNSGSQTSNNSGENTSSNSGENTSNSGENTSSNNGENTRTSENQDEIERQIREQLMSYEDGIETKLKDTLNTKFQENIVSNVDIKTFTIDSNQSTNTTLLANGYVNFVGDAITYTTNLGMPLDADAFIDLAPISYAEVDQTKDLAENYGIDELKSVSDYITGENLSFNYATLNDANWDLDCFTASQVESYLEQRFSNMVVDYFTELDGKPWVNNVDLKCFETTEDSTYGNIVSLSGTTQSIKTGKVMSYNIVLGLSDSDYNLLNAALNTENEVNSQNELAQNYKFTTLSTLKNVLENDSTTVIKYIINDSPYILNNDRTL